MAKYLRSFRLFALLPVIFWLLGQLSLAQAAITLGSLTSDKTLQAFNADLLEIVICTPSGLKKVKVTPDGTIQEETELYPGCPWCQTFGTAWFLSEPAHQVTTLEFTGHRIIWPETGIRPSHSPHHQSARSRAPPF